MDTSRSIAYFECLHELKLIVDLMQRYGIAGMYRGVSETARYGGLTVGGNVINQETKERMRNALRDIQSGAFAESWVSAYQNEKGRAFEKYLDELDAHPIELVGRRFREMMWPSDVSASGKAPSWSKLQTGGFAKAQKNPLGKNRNQARKKGTGRDSQKQTAGSIGFEDCVTFKQVCKKSRDTRRNPARSVLLVFRFLWEKKFPSQIF